MNSPTQRRTSGRSTARVASPQTARARFYTSDVRSLQLRGLSRSATATNIQRVPACERPVAWTAPVSIRLRHRSVGWCLAAAVPLTGCRKGALDLPPGGALLCGMSVDTHLVVEALLTTHRYSLKPPPGPLRFWLGLASGFNCLRNAKRCQPVSIIIDLTTRRVVRRFGPKPIPTGLHSLNPFGRRAQRYARNAVEVGFLLQAP